MLGALAVEKFTIIAIHHRKGAALTVASYVWQKAFRAHVLRHVTGRVA